MVEMLRVQGLVYGYFVEVFDLEPGTAVNFDLFDWGLRIRHEISAFLGELPEIPVSISKDCDLIGPVLTKMLYLVREDMVLGHGGAYSIDRGFESSTVVVKMDRLGTDPLRFHDDFKANAGSPDWEAVAEEFDKLRGLQPDPPVAADLVADLRQVIADGVKEIKVERSKLHVARGQARGVAASDPGPVTGTMAGVLAAVSKDQRTIANHLGNLVRTMGALENSVTPARDEFDKMDYFVNELARQGKALNEAVADIREAAGMLEDNYPDEVKAMDVDVLNLSPRPHNALLDANIKTVGHVLGLRMKGLKMIKNLGAKSVNEIRRALADRGIMLRD